jgi:predicted ABC-type ATPase
VAKVAIIAGPNGSGKTTFYQSKLRARFPTFVNADELAASLSEVPPEIRNREAANRAEAVRQDLLTRRADFAFETVFSRTSHWLEFLGKLSAACYQIWLFFI